MGTYGLVSIDLIKAMAETLDNLEGDFSTHSLLFALEKMKKYPYTSNSRRSEKIWKKLIDANCVEEEP